MIMCMCMFLIRLRVLLRIHVFHVYILKIRHLAGTLAMCFDKKKHKKGKKGPESPEKVRPHSGAHVDDDIHFLPGEMETRGVMGRVDHHQFGLLS